MRTYSAGLIIAMTLVVACHGAPLPAIPGKGGPPWVELQSEHFTLWTDASAGRGRQLIKEMEHHRQVVLGVGFASARAGGRSFVIALRDAEEVAVFLTPQFIAYAWSGGALRQPMILISADADDDNSHVITHELTHVISYNVIRSQPHWFAEGLANFFETVRLDPDTASGGLGKPLDHIVATLRTDHPTPSAAMFACNEHSCMDDGFYATAWALFSFLANTHSAELLRYAQRLDELPEAEQSKAWAEVFPDLTPDKLDSELRKWLAYGKHTEFKFNVKLQDWPITERPLHDADVLAARATLRYMFARDQSQPPPELAEALALDPASLLAQLLSVAIKESIAVEDAQRVAEANPDDWRAWYLVGLANDWHGEPARVAHDKACEILAQHPTVGAPTEWCNR